MPTVAAPRLLRAIAESTQPYGPLDTGQGFHALEVRPDSSLWLCPSPCPGADIGSCMLQEYLQEPGSVDAVFKGIVDRASAEPLR